jgi:hypothetical protein
MKLKNYLFLFYISLMASQDLKINKPLNDNSSQNKSNAFTEQAFLIMKCVGLGMILIALIPIIIGFRRNGVRGGSLAAFCQAKVGNVGRRSLFSHCLSLGMKGLFVIVLIVGAILLVSPFIAEAELFLIHKTDESSGDANKEIEKEVTLNKYNNLK